jgi:hypothetical protein
VSKKTNDRREVIGLVGVGLDQQDGETRVTRNEDILLVGGSAETHERLQDVSIKFNDGLKDSGKALHEAEIKEVLELLRRAFED